MSSSVSLSHCLTNYSRIKGKDKELEDVGATRYMYCVYTEIWTS